ncbi:MAG: hypothetical protein JST89_01865 [Cyanobacteria bacterium SZAS-4]|nr:hypothetical protein [Cyanobacteria bacterium SZAS-4]
MQSGTHKEVTFSEPEVTASAVELCVHEDEQNAPVEAAARVVEAESGPAEKSEQSSASESTVEPTNESAAESESPAEPSPESRQKAYQAFSETFGQTNQKSSSTFFQNWANTWDRKLKQPFNIAYFMVSTAAIGAVSVLWNLPIMWLIVGVFGIFTLAAFRAAWSYRVHPNDFAVTLPDWSRHSLRTGALLLPVPFFAILLAQPLAYNELNEGQRLFSDGKYKDAINHFNRAAALNPQLEQTYQELADCYNFAYDHQNSLIAADKALKLDPTDGAAWASKAWALNKQSKYAEALPAALKAVEFFPESGQANHALADAYFNLGEYDLALAPATKHIEIHDRESSALELRADIFDKLGRSAEAASDRAAAAKLD